MRAPDSGQNCRCCKQHQNVANMEVLSCERPFLDDQVRSPCSRAAIDNFIRIVVARLLVLMPVLNSNSSPAIKRADFTSEPERRGEPLYRSERGTEHRAGKQICQGVFG
jgi:hypothetical protein